MSLKCVIKVFLVVPIPPSRLPFYWGILCCKESGCQMLVSEILVFHKTELGALPKEFAVPDQKQRTCQEMQTVIQEPH